jgi:predicted secreted protein
MSWATGVMVYLVIWWTVLFAVLPLGVNRVKNPGRGEDRGAPEHPDLVRKAIITTIVAGVLWVGFYLLHQADIFSFRRMVEQAISDAPIYADLV